MKAPKTHFKCEVDLKIIKLNFRANSLSSCAKIEKTLKFLNNKIGLPYKFTFSLYVDI